MTDEKQPTLTCLLMGEESLLVQCGSTLIDRGHAIVGVIAGTPAIAAWARDIGATVIEPGPGLAGRVQGLAYDWFFSIANLKLVPKAIWQGAGKGSANFHDGPLPRFAGLNTPAWAILAGETHYGVTWHALSEGIDEGDIYTQSAFSIEPDDTALTMNTKCFAAGISSFGDLLDRIEQRTLTGIPQDFSTRTYFAKDQRPDVAATLDFSATSIEIDRLARALNFGEGYNNPLALPKLRVAGTAHLVGSLQIVEGLAKAEPGTIISVEPAGAVIATADGAVRIGLIDAHGGTCDATTVLTAGASIDALTAVDADSIRALARETAKLEDFFLERLQTGRPPELDGLMPPALGADAKRTQHVASPTGQSQAHVIAAICGYFARTGAASPLRLAVTDAARAADAAALPGYLAPSVPLVVPFDADTTVAQLIKTVDAELALLKDRRGYPADLVARHPKPGIAPDTVSLVIGQSVHDVAGTPAAFIVSNDGRAVSLVSDSNRLPVEAADALVQQAQAFFAAFGPDASARISDLPIMSAAEEAAVVHDRNATACDFDRAALVHKLIEAQALRTPSAIALACEDVTLTYRDLDAQANRVARRLVALGVMPDQPVGLYLNRSVDLVIGALAILKAGGAYVPLDVGYPEDRIAYMIEDSGLSIVLSRQGLTPPVSSGTVSVVAIEDALASDDSTAPATDVQASNLAYVIYTSGSTGRPKGVMVEHRNVVNFFAGMDGRVTRSGDTQDVWLAVTSLSFDISVLELFWTLARGFKVVVQTDERKAVSRPKRHAGRIGGMDFSLFFWGNDDGVGPRKYQLLLDSARFADSHGFRAVWTPERHFHAFGGPYPNPAVTGAAVAALTRNLDIRAGSCVLPLHHPARVVEEWAVIDNISNGRAGLAFASGWMPEDFLLRPENAPPNNKSAMLRDIEVVRKLWRGEAVAFPAPGGKSVDVITQPRPVRGELPIWVTTAGNPDTYRDAAKLGANVLTHLLGQSVEEVGEKVKIYRQTLAETGRNPADYTVTLMLHTLLGEDREEVRDKAREPMKAYLRSAVALIKQYAWAFPAFKKPTGVSNAMEVDLQTLDPDELDAIIEFAFLRYFDDSGLFGTVDDALARIEQVKAIGVDEIACLIDFGVPTATALDALAPLAEMVAVVNPKTGTAEVLGDYSLGGLIRAHGVTHMQCTPSMAAMMLMNDDDRTALSGVRHLFVGGEALQGALLRELRSVTGATIENMYGPTETTVWSSTMTAPAETDGVVPLGSPIANTQLYILDEARRPVPAGTPGELYIGGDGVTRGYLHRAELTAERFLPNPFTKEGRIYRTGDLVRWDKSGVIQFIGRADHQVKVRGYRIELGEIEAQLGTHPSVAEAVVVVREDKANDVRIVAYLRPKGSLAAPDELRAHVLTKLPDFMVPAHFVSMEKFPLTPNAKVDRKQLPRPEDARAQQKAAADAKAVTFVAPDGDVPQRIAETFKRVLGIERVGVNDNFFTLGGHSLLAVQVHRELKATLTPDLTITDIYRFPTVAGLAAHISDRGSANKHLGQVAERAAMRRNAMAGRRAPART